jgi:hypothetical protein
MDMETWKYEDMDMEIWRHGHGDMETWTLRHGDVARKSEAQKILLNPFTDCSSFKQKLVVRLFVDEETNGSYPFAIGLNGLAPLCV